jgi:hypothetical protein
VSHTVAAFANGTLPVSVPPERKQESKRENEGMAPHTYIHGWFKVVSKVL